MYNLHFNITKSAHYYSTLFLGLARLGRSKTEPFGTVRTVLVFCRTGPLSDGPGPQDRGPQSCLTTFDRKTVRTVLDCQFYLKNVSFYARFGLKMTQTRLNTAVSDVFRRSRSPAFFRTTVLDCPDGPDSPKSIRFCGLDCPKIVGLKIVSARASPNKETTNNTFIFLCPKHKCVLEQIGDYI